MRLALVAMPWSRRDRPSAGVAAIASYVRSKRPRWSVRSRSEYVEVSEQIGRELYDALSDAAYTVADMLYAPLLYPEKTDDVRGLFLRWAATVGWPEPEATFTAATAVLRERVDALSEALAGSADVLGLTTCFGQLFANLALAKALKERAPDAKVVLGGSTVSSRVGASLLREYPQVDYVVQGEGEQPLVALLDTLAAGEPPPGPERGVLSRSTMDAASRAGAKMWEVGTLDSLPLPDYDEYAALAESYDIDWHLPLETSRGCWWDRTKRSGNPRATCYFCNLNVQWGGYREKSAARVVSEMVSLTERHRNLKLFFVDNIIRHQGVPALAEAIKGTGKDYEIFYEMRANISPYEFMLMWEAGLRSTQFGVEGLSSSFLSRIGKGTTAIQNLQAMRLCTEFGVENLANLIVDFPGATEEEVAETARTLLEYALSFYPLNIAKFHLGVDSTADTQREAFGVVNVRNSDEYKHALPEDVWRRVHMLDLDFDLTGAKADWSPVRAACAKWEALHNACPGLRLSYRDGGTFLTIEDLRSEDVRVGTFEGLAREVYLHCMEVRSLEQLVRRFGNEAAILEATGQFVADRLMFTERNRFLSLAVATSPHVASRRIRAAVPAEPAVRARPRLPLVPTE